MTQDAPTVRSNRPHAADTATRLLDSIVSEIEAKRWRAYSDVLRDPRLARREPGLPEVDVALPSDDATALITEYWFRTNHETVGPVALSHVVPVLRGLALNNPSEAVLDEKAIARLKNDPLLMTVYEFVMEKMGDGSTFETSPTDLWKTLQDKAKRTWKGFPAGANALSRLLKSLSPDLAALGLAFEQGKSDARRIWTFRKARDDPATPSREAPDDISSPRKDLGRTDDQAIRLAALQKRANKSMNL